MSGGALPILWIAEVLIMMIKLEKWTWVSGATDLASYLRDPDIATSKSMKLFRVGYEFIHIHSIVVHRNRTSLTSDGKSESLIL